MGALLALGAVAVLLALRATGHEASLFEPLPNGRKAYRDEQLVLQRAIGRAAVQLLQSGQPLMLGATTMLALADEQVHIVVPATTPQGRAAPAVHWLHSSLLGLVAQGYNIWVDERWHEKADGSWRVQAIHEDSATTPAPGMVLGIESER